MNECEPLAQLTRMKLPPVYAARWHEGDALHRHFRSPIAFVVPKELCVQLRLGSPCENGHFIIRWP
jgi:hypothetical protein